MSVLTIIGIIILGSFILSVIVSFAIIITTKSIEKRIDKEIDEIMRL